jgi:tetratricopeptide (TPR) repeat protein
VSKGRFAHLEFGEGSRPGGPAGDLPERAEGEQHFVAEVKGAAHHLARAEEGALAGDFDRALRSFSAALGEDPLRLEAWVGQLLMLVALEEYSEARTWADKALEKFPGNPDLLAAKATALHRAGLRREARDLCDAALAAKGESGLVWLCRGEVMLAGSRQAAEHCFAHAQRLAGNKPLMQLRIADCCLRQGDCSTALPMLRNATAALPRSALAWHLLGSAQEKLGLFEQARTSHQQAARLDPRNDKYKAAATSRGPTLGQRVAGFFRRTLGR